jgi:hypothetical protein
MFDLDDADWTALSAAGVLTPLHAAGVATPRYALGPVQALFTTSDPQ